MKQFFNTFRVLTRNFGLVWPPVVTFVGFLLLGLIPVLLLFAGGVMFGFDNLLSGNFPDFSEAAGLAVGFGILAFIIYALIYFVLYLFLLAFMNGGIYNVVSGVLNGDRHYWRNFGRGGLRYLGWSILYGIISFIIGLIGQILINSVLSGKAFPEHPSVAASIVNTIYSIVVFYLFALFLPALVDGKERFMDAMATSFRLAWRTFLVTILPALLLVVILLVLVLAIVGLGALLHPVVAILLFIPVFLYFVPFFSIWMTLVYRRLTDKPVLTGPHPPADDNPIQPQPPADENLNE